MRVLCCGGREWRNRDIIAKRLAALPIGEEITIVHGACRGADQIAMFIGHVLGFSTEAHPANWKKYGKAAGVIRNQEMLDSGVDLVLAFHANLERSKGTKDMVERARKAGVKVEVIGDEAPLAG